MTWVTWRQHRGEALVVGAALALLGALLIWLGRDIYATFQQLGVGDCLAHPDHPNCSQIVESFRGQYGAWEETIPWLNFAPAVLAMLVGAPLVARELEHGTQRLVWTQSVTRGRWIAVKLIAVLAGGLVVGALLIALFTWWRWPFDQLEGRLHPAGFDFEGIVLAGYVAFALSLAIAAGALLRRAIPAMAVTLVGFLAVRLPIEFVLRPLYQPALTLISSPNQASATVARVDWVVSRGWVDSLGHHLSDAQVFGACLPQNPNDAGATKNAVFDCIASHGWKEYVSYQPADRFWTFQAIETGIYVVLAVGLLALTIWWVQRRIA
jgi:hypothetical protein